MGNGTTCNLHLVKQNAKKKGEVSTGLFFLIFLYTCGCGVYFFHPQFSFTKPALFNHNPDIIVDEVSGTFMS